MEQDLINQLLAQPALTAVVGQEITFDVRNPAAGLPALVLHKISGVPDYTTQGQSGLTPYRVQFDALGVTVVEALAVQRAVLLAIGQLAAPFAGIGFVLDQHADFSRDPAPDASGATDLFRQALDVRLWHLAQP